MRLGICCDFKIVTWFLLSRRLARWLLLFAFSWKSAALPGICPNPLTLLLYTPLQLPLSGRGKRRFVTVVFVSAVTTYLQI